MDLLDELVNNIFETDYHSLPIDVIEATKKQILDILAACVGGSTCSVSKELESLVDMVREWGGKEESSIIAFGGRVPAHNAAFINAVTCVRLDFDDTFAMLVRNHPSRSVVPVAFAVAERQKNVDGKQLITAVALGHDLECRLKLAVGRDLESPIGFTTNFLGAASTAGKLIGLNKDKFKNALGIAVHFISGAKSGMGTAGAGASLKGLNNGMAAKSGIISALLADKGFSGSWDFLDSNNKNNFYAVFHNGLFWPEMITLDLGKVFMGALTSLKEFPCCHGQHPALEVTLDIIKKHGLKAEEIDEVQLYLSPVDYFLLAYPVEKKQNPSNAIETQFSICWGVASAIVLQNVTLKNFNQEALGNNQIKQIVKRVFTKPDISLAGPIHCPCIVEIKTKDGKTYKTKSSAAPYGSPENPLSFSDIESKFRHCCEYSIKPITKEKQNLVIKMIQNLEDIDDVGKIVKLLA